MKLTVLGSCSGTEPMPGRKHVSFAIEAGGGVYWFDAGEGCSYTAHLAGIDLLAVRAIFITHTHMDHVGGLPNLLWNMRKINGITNDPSRRLSGKRVQAFLPYMPTWDAAVQLLKGTEGGFKIDYELEAERYYDGEVFNDGILRVIAHHNTHLGAPADRMDWRSYSFRIEVDGANIVYSGDVASIEELAPILSPCDMLLMETGHHKVEDICHYLRDSRAEVGRLIFIHHGRDILDDAQGQVRKAEAIMGRPAIVAEDGMVIECGPGMDARVTRIR